MMLRRTFALAALPLSVVLTLAGCTSSVSFDKTVTLETGGLKAYSIDAPRGEQKVRVQVDSAQPIDVDVALDADTTAVQKKLEAGVRPTQGVLTSKTGVTQGSLDATIPAGKAFTVLLSGAKKQTEVKLSVKSL